MTNQKRLSGHEAIDYAELHGRVLSKFTDPTEDAREGLSVEDARDVARYDAGLIYLDLA